MRTKNQQFRSPMHFPFSMCQEKLTYNDNIRSRRDDFITLIGQLSGMWGGLESVPLLIQKIQTHTTHITLQNVMKLSYDHAIVLLHHASWRSLVLPGTRDSAYGVSHILKHRRYLSFSLHFHQSSFVYYFVQNA